jgi:tetratricopeptide (TPR) repeat protein
MPNVFGQEGKSRREITRECRALLKSATALIKAAETDSAMIFLDSIFIIDNKNPDAYYFKGKILAQKGDTLKAIDLLSDGMEKAPRSTRLRLLLANLKIKKQMLDEAEPILDQILAIKPNESKALYYKGIISMQKGDTAAAVTFYEKGLNQILKKK